MWATILLWTLGTTALFEIVTCVCRFAIGWRSREFAGRYKRYTLGIRWHHGYFGVLLLPPVLLLVPAASPIHAPLIATGAGLIVSDLLHHFVVLPITTGEMD